MEHLKKQPVVRDDLYQFPLLSEVSLSPGGIRAAYVIHHASKESNRYDSEIWCINLNDRKNRPLVSQGNPKNPVWLDAENLIFTSQSTSKDGQAETSFYRISVNGSEPQHFMTIPLKGAKVLCLDEDRFLVNVSVTEKEDPPGADLPFEITQDDCWIFEELPFWLNGKGVCSRKRQALYLFDRAANRLTRISKPYQDVVSFAVSPDKTKMAFSGPIYDSVRPRTWGVWLYNIPSGAAGETDLQSPSPVLETADQRFAAATICFLGNTRIFFSGTTFQRAGKHPRFYTYDLETGKETRLPFLDFAIGNSVTSDARFGTGISFKYCPERHLLYLIQTSWGNSHIMALAIDGAMDETMAQTMDGTIAETADATMTGTMVQTADAVADGTLTQVTRTPGTVSGFDVSGNTMVMMAMRGNDLDELYLVDPDSGREERLTKFCAPYMDSHKVVSPEELRYHSANGWEMNGYIVPPADYEPGRKYPAILEIHGGPKAAFGSIFFHEAQCLANDGCFVLLPNPRGSSGRSETFADLTERLGKDDFADVMEFLDQALAACPDIDENRLGICGGSYGGFLCNWIVGHTDRFAAAVSLRSISNYITKCLYTDNGYQTNRLQAGAYAWEDFHKVWNMSPLSAVGNVRTPILFLHSDEDYRCWMGEAFQMYSAVKRQGTDTRIVLFHGENHEMSRTGKPENRIARLRELEDWFQKYLHIS